MTGVLILTRQLWPGDCPGERECLVREAVVVCSSYKLAAHVDLVVLQTVDSLRANITSGFIRWLGWIFKFGEVAALEVAGLSLRPLTRVPLLVIYLAARVLLDTLLVSLA